MNPQQRAQYLGYLMTQGMTFEEATKQMNSIPSTSTVSQQNPSDINRQAKAPNMVFGNNDMPNAVTGPSFNMANYDFINPNATQKPNVLNQQPTLYGTDGTNPNKVIPKNMKEFTSKDEWMRYKESQGEDPMLAGRNWDEQMGTSEEESPQGPMGGYNQGASGMPLWYPGGSDISTELFTMGRGLGAAKGAKGKNAAIIAGGGAALFDITRNVLAGVGYEKSNQYVENEYRKNQYGPDSRDYNRQRQYKNSNAFGEMDFEQGGMFGSFAPDLIRDYKRKFEEGGEQFEEQTDAVQSPQEENQEEPHDQMQQVQMMIAQALQQGKEPQEIVQALVQKGIPQEQAMQMVAQVAQQMQQQNMEQSGEEPEMKKGGKFKHNVGDYIEFKVDGKIKKGKIKRIENGKIFL